MSDPKQVMERHIAAENDRNYEADPWSADAELVAPGAQLRGREQILDFNRGFWEAFPDGRLKVIRSVAEGSCVAAEWVMIGTHSGVLRTPNGEVPPTGRRVELRGMVMYEVRGDELVSEHLYFDQAEFLTQLGLAPAPAEAAG